MDNLKSVELTVAKLCHEMANSLSVMKFLQEDIDASQNHELKELFKTVDLLTYTMDFFRRIYSLSENSIQVNGILLDILQSKNISLIGNLNIFSNASPIFDNVICGILYICMKACREADSILIEETGEKIVISVSNRTLPQEVVKALQGTDVTENIFNTFALYIKNLAKLNHIDIISDINPNNISITLWNRK